MSITGKLKDGVQEAIGGCFVAWKEIQTVDIDAFGHLIDSRYLLIAGFVVRIVVSVQVNAS